MSKAAHHDVESTVQSILRGSTKDGFSTIVSISCNNHTYLKQWKSIEWSLVTFKGIVEVVRRYEVDELKYDGRSAWILYMMLEHGTQSRAWSYFEDDRELINTMIATLLRILIEHANYNQVFLIFKTLQSKYGMNPAEIFSIGCALLEQLPASIKDGNFIALLDLAITFITNDRNCVSPAMKMLAYCSNFVICDWTSNFFLDQKLPLFVEIFLWSVNIVDGKLRFETIFDTVQLLRRLATMHEQNADHITNESNLMAQFVTLLFTKNMDSVPIPPAVQREIVATLNVLTRLPKGAQRIRSIADLSNLRDLVSTCDDLLVTESIVDLFFNLYESDLEYWDDAFHYMILDHAKHDDFLHSVLLQCLRTLENDFPEKDSTPSAEAVQSMSMIGIHLDAVARICFRLERSIFILSDARSLLPMKTSLIQVCTRIVGEDPSKFPLRYHAVVDILCYILRGTQRCWVPAPFDPLDEDFIFVSSALVEQFLSVTRKKIFDHKDANSLHYLAGADAHSPIQTLIAKGNEHQTIVESANLRRHKSRGSSLVSADLLVTATVNEPNIPASPINNEFLQKEQERQAYLAAVEVLLKQIVKRISWVRRNVSYWELDSSDVAARRVCYITLLVRLFGVTMLEQLIPDFQHLRSMIFQLLVDPSLSLNSFIGIESKCLQVLSLLSLHHGSFDQALQCYEYLTKIILSNPEMLSERRRSEYQREQVSFDSRSLSSPGGTSTLLGFSPPRESMLFASGFGTNNNTNSSSNGVSIATETGNLLGVQLQLLYDALNALLVLSEVDRSVRRKLVSSCSSLLDCLSYYTPVDPVLHRPVLHLIASFIEFAPKFELSAEEAIVTVMIRSLNSPLHYVRYQTCNLIYHIGLESPGFVFRGLSRREVEDPVLDIISHSPFEYPRLIVAAIKAAATLVHNFNIKPVWLPSPILYHWRCYQPHLAQRPFLGISGLALVINLLRHAQVPYRLLYFTYTLSLSASLMYACSELTGNPNPNDMRALQELKDYLIANILPWLPLAIDFISLGKRKRRFDFMEMLPPSAGGGSSPSSASSSAPSNSKTTSPATASATASASASAATKKASELKTTSNPIQKNGAKKTPVVEKPYALPELVKRMYATSLLPSSCTSSSEEHFQLFHAVHHTLWSYMQVQFSMEHYDESSAIIGDISDIVQIRLLTPEERRTLYPALQMTTSCAPPSSTDTSARESNGQTNDNSATGSNHPPPPQHKHAADVSSMSEQNASTAIDVLQASPSESSPYHKEAHSHHHHLHHHHHHHQRDTNESIYRSKSMEFLTVKTIDALYAFLCMDDMFPLSTYLRYTHLFEQCHVIASVSYFMSEHYENALVLKRGMDLLRYFADHQMQLSSIAMHSPPALIAAVRLMQDSLEAQLSFAKIILSINRTDDEFARENLLRFRVHQVLLELVLRETNTDLIRISIQALLALAATEAHVREIARVELPASLAPTKPAHTGYGNSSSSNNNASAAAAVVLVGTGPLVPLHSSTGNSSSGGGSATDMSGMKGGQQQSSSLSATSLSAPISNGQTANANAIAARRNSGTNTTATNTTATTSSTASTSHHPSSSNSNHNHNHNSTVVVSQQTPAASRNTTTTTTGSPVAVGKQQQTPDDSPHNHNYHAHLHDGAEDEILPPYHPHPTTPFVIIPKPPSTFVAAASSSGGGASSSSTTASSSKANNANSSAAALTINLIDVLLYVLETQNKELRTHYYALRLLVLMEAQYKTAVHQVLRKSPLANAIKKSKKVLKKVYVDDVNAAALAAGEVPLSSSSGRSGGSGHSNHSNNSSNAHGMSGGNHRGMSVDNSASSGKGDDIEKRDVELLLSEPIIKNDRCVIS